ncbi:SRPBCC domain-containing protein [Aeromicrobium sp. CTD01-1L150]|uniref:SRPBCC domain-containing protein n=1 Tax=Aeromicrobium sp. CTD01-1L150 TaxID=3341830 RepID=UPI0035C1FF18
MTSDGIIVDDETNTLHVTRTYDAGIERVWRAWTEPAALERWWGPEGWTTTVHELEARPGGRWRHTMVPDDGSDDPVRTLATYRTVEPMNLLGFADSFADDDWNALGTDTFPTTVAFADQHDRTRVSVAAAFPTTEALGRAIDLGMGEGFHEALDRLAGHLARQSS